MMHTCMNACSQQCLCSSLQWRAKRNERVYWTIWCANAHVLVQKCAMWHWLFLHLSVWIKFEQFSTRLMWHKEYIQIAWLIFLFFFPHIFTVWMTIRANIEFVFQDRVCPLNQQWSTFREKICIPLILAILSKDRKNRKERTRDVSLDLWI